MRPTPSRFLAASALLSLVSCSSAEPPTRFVPDPARLRAISTTAPDQAPAAARTLAPETPRPGHTHPDTAQQPIELFEVEGTQDPDRDRIRVRRIQRHDTRESPTILVLRDHQRPAPRPNHRRKYHFENEGWYIGGSYGWTDGNESGGKLQYDLNRRTPSGRDVAVALDDTDWGFKGFVGYRFDNPFALELGYTGLDGPDSAIATTVIDTNLIADVGELHPITGRGPSLSLLGHPSENDRLSTFAKLGFWYWQADVDVDLAGTRVNKSPDGFDFVVGLGAQYRLIDGLGARVEYERYFLDDFGVDMLSVGLTYKF